MFYFTIGLVLLALTVVLARTDHTNWTQRDDYAYYFMWFITAIFLTYGGVEIFFK